MRFSRYQRAALRGLLVYRTLDPLSGCDSIRCVKIPSAISSVYFSHEVHPSKILPFYLYRVQPRSSLSIQRILTVLCQPLLENYQRFNLNVRLLLKDWNFNDHLTYWNRSRINFYINYCTSIVFYVKIEIRFVTCCFKNGLTCFECERFFECLSI